MTSETFVSWCMESCRLYPATRYLILPGYALLGCWRFATQDTYGTHASLNSMVFLWAAFPDEEEKLCIPSVGVINYWDILYLLLCILCQPFLYQNVSTIITILLHSYRTILMSLATLKISANKVKIVEAWRVVIFKTTVTQSQNIFFMEK